MRSTPSWMTLKVNSKLTEGEDIADFGGLILAWIAWKDQTKNTHCKPAMDLRLSSASLLGTRSGRVKTTGRKTCG